MPEFSAPKLSVGTAVQVDRLCIEFEQALDGPNLPQIEDFLDRVDRHARPTLLFELLCQELEYHARRNQVPDQDAYLARFPDDRACVRAAFAEPTSTPVETRIIHPTPTGRPLPDARQPLQAGHRIGPFEILSEIGRGGMGVVYKACDRQLDRLVALKTIRSETGDDDESIRRFQTEAQAAAQLQHANIVPIYSVGRAAGRDYIAMALIEGPSLASRIQAAPLAPREAAQLVERVALAIDAAHQHDVVHRDLKPSNILTDSDGCPYVTDFGLAKQLGGPGELTLTGQVIGTPGYMSPEQARGDRVGKGADIYALGAVLYSVLTGRAPFQAASLAATIHQIIHQEVVSPRQLNPLIDRDLETICVTCLAKETSERYPSAAAVAEDLNRYLQRRPILARPLSPAALLARWARRNPRVAGLSVALFAALLVGLLTVSWLYGESREYARQLERSQREALEAEQEARDEAERANAVSRFVLEDMIGAIDPDRNQSDVLLVDVIEESVPKLAARFSGMPQMHADLLQEIGIVYHKLGALEAAEDALRQSAVLYQAELGARSAKTLTAQANLALVLDDRGSSDEAASLLQRVFDIERADPPAYPELVTTAINLGEIRQSRSEFDAAETLLRQALDQNFGPLTEDQQLHVSSTLSAMLLAQQRPAEAEATLRETIALAEAKKGKDHSIVLAARNNLATSLMNQDRTTEAIELLTDLHARMQSKYPTGHWRAALSGLNLGIAHVRLQELPQAESLIRDAYHTLNEQLGPDHHFTETALGKLVDLSYAVGRLEQATGMHQLAVKTRLRIAGPGEGRSVGQSIGEYELTAQEYGQGEHVAPFFASLADYVRGLEPQTRGRRRALANWGWALVHRKDLKLAERLLAQSLAEHRADLPADDPDIEWCRKRLAICYERAEKPELAAELRAP